MVYVWSWPKGIPDRYHIRMDYKRSPSLIKISLGGERLPDNFGTYFFTSKVDQNKLRRLHVPPVGDATIVSPEIRKILETHAKDFVQFMPVSIQTLDGVCTDYSALHVLPLIRDEHIDQQKSYFQDGTRFDKNGKKKKLCFAVYSENCLGDLPIAISENYGVKILVSESLHSHLSAYSDIGLVTQEEATAYFLKFSSSSPYAVKGADWEDR